MGRLLATIVSGVIIFVVPAASAQSRAAESAASAADTHAVKETSLQLHNGVVEFALNPDALATAGLRIADVKDASARMQGAPGVRYEVVAFTAQADGGLQIQRRGAEIAGLGKGASRFSGGFSLAYPGGKVDLHQFALRASSAAGLGMDVMDAHGQVWLTADHAHYGLADDASGGFSMTHMNLRLAPRFAQQLGRPDLADAAIGNLDLHATTGVDARAQDASGAKCSAPWPAPGRVTDIEVFESNLSGFWDSIYAPRCGLPPLPNGGACTATSTNGRLVLGADASLRNIGKTAVAWYGHFSGKHPPYDNDQHPFLIWNLYRVDSDDRILQIGASGVKHAFYSINKNCGCDAGNVFWPGCEDIYSFSSNDNGGGTSEQNLAPRSEIIPYGAKWGRCGSIWDADCDGRMDAGSGAHDLYQYRMQVEESDLLAPHADGAQYFFEYWYIVRDDANIYNTMGYRQIQPRKAGANWSVGLVNANAPDHDFFVGPAINRWVDPANPPAHAMNKELATPLGRARIAVKVTDLGKGRWRYQYAIMNFDYAHADIDPAHPHEPDMKLRSNHGFARFSVPVPAGTDVQDVRFDDADDDERNQWTVSADTHAVTWTAPASGNTLDWGTLYAFEFTAHAKPGTTRISLQGAPTSSESGSTYTLALLGPTRR